MPDDAPDPSNPPDKELSEEEKLFAKVEALKEKTRVSHQLPEVPDWNFQRPSAGPGSKPKPGPSDDGQARSLGIGISVAYSLVGAMVGGAALGWLCDRFLHTGGAGLAIGGLIGAIFGIVATIMLVNKSNK